jgi:nucleotide-binding universal stress UspA family protein
MRTTGPLLIAYDGSANARTAIDTAAELLPGATAVVLYARQPLESLAAHLEGHPALEELRGLDTASFDASERLAAEGAELAQKAGLAAEPRVASTVATAADAIVEVADRLDARAIVLGSRGRRAVAAALLGSTSANVLHHSRRPVLVIPPAEPDQV